MDLVCLRLARRLSDLVGGDIGLNVGRSYHEAYGDRVYASPLVMMMNEAKNLGEKTGKGGQPCWSFLFRLPTQ